MRPDKASTHPARTDKSEGCDHGNDKQKALLVCMSFKIVFAVDVADADIDLQTLLVQLSLRQPFLDAPTSLFKLRVSQLVILFQIFSLNGCTVAVQD